MVHALAHLAQGERHQRCVPVALQGLALAVAAGEARRGLAVRRQRGRVLDQGLVQGLTASQRGKASRMRGRLEARPSSASTATRYGVDVDVPMVANLRASGRASSASPGRQYVSQREPCGVQAA
jgi:hypothetical protein